MVNNLELATKIPDSEQRLRTIDAHELPKILYENNITSELEQDCWNMQFKFAWDIQDEYFLPNYLTVLLKTKEFSINEELQLKLDEIFFQRILRFDSLDILVIMRLAHQVEKYQPIFEKCLSKILLYSKYHQQLSMLYEFILAHPEYQSKIVEEIKKEIYINQKELEDIDDWEQRNSMKEYKSYR